MIGWLSYKVMRWASDYENKKERKWEENCVAIAEGGGTIEMPDPIRFKIQPAQGGTIVELQSYDNKKNERIIKIHVIADGKDIAESIGNIVTMELLRR